MTAWLAQFPQFATASVSPASTDASFRRYFRVSNDDSYIVMDAPPDQEDCRPFIEVAKYLESMDLNSPRVVEQDPAMGFLLLTDLGCTQYLEELDRSPERADALYRDALAALQTMQVRGRNYQGNLPRYDEQLLRFELSLFHDWLCEAHLELTFSRQDESMWQACCDLLVDNALQQPSVFVHRDYHSRNLMLTDENNPGILDFQDAVCGPLTYDLVSLLKDCYIKWPAEQVNKLAHGFRAALPVEISANMSGETFQRRFDLMGVQRHLKAAGIFARLLRRDGKDGYMQDVPRTLSYIVDLAPGYAELDGLITLIVERVLPALETGQS